MRLPFGYMALGHDYFYFSQMFQNKVINDYCIKFSSFTKFYYLEFFLSKYHHRDNQHESGIKQAINGMTS